MGEQLTMERFYWFHAQVRAGNYPNATSLARQFELSTRTARRSIEFMRDRFHAPLEYDASRKGFYYTDQSFELPHLLVSQEELLAVLLAQNLLSHSAGGIISDAISSFGQKLFTRLGDLGLPETRMKEAFSATWNGFAPTQASIFRTAVDALLQKRLLNFIYTSPRTGLAVKRLVEPHHLQHYNGSWVLIAFCRAKLGWRKFYLSRMTDPAVARESFVSRHKKEWQHELEGAYGIFQGKEKIPVTLLFTPFRARWIREQVWHPEQKMTEQPDGSIEMTFPVADFREVKLKILQFGADVEVVGPEDLRQEIAEEISRMAEIYVLAQG
jgi:predicted DNA-binding transcriptional regulator YafY